ncbi:MAG: hypothetical protein WDA02_02170 [Saccharofermentanales bacterium]
MFDEMKFLFEMNRYISPNKTPDIRVKKEHDENTDSFNINNYTITQGDSKNYIKSSVNSAYSADKKNPYLKLLEDFNSQNAPSQGLVLNPTDFAYLRDIGVQPINKLVILRRFPIGTVVPRDLNNINVKPISVVIGWIKNDNNDLLNFSFGEVWRTQNKDEMLHLLINQMMSKEFGLGMDSILPVPGWLAGTLFGILRSVGLVSPDTKVPFGDPNVLRESITREHEDVGHKSSFKISFDTVYEQKFIGDVDITSSTMNILQNLLTMGTSDIRFIGAVNSTILRDLRAANNNPTNPDAWVRLIKTIFGKVVDSIVKLIPEQIEVEVEVQPQPSIGNDETEEEEDLSKNDETTDDTTTNGVDNQPKTETRMEYKNEDEKRRADIIEKQTSLLNDVLSSTLVKDILSSTVAKYVWPMRGSIAMLTGEAATPWHLTIGNPYAPLLSLNNVKVNNVEVTFTGEMQYNDIPKYIKVNLDLDQGRNMGKNEILDSIGIEYQRKYNQI